MAPAPVDLRRTPSSPRQTHKRLHQQSKQNEMDSSHIHTPATLSCSSSVRFVSSSSCHARDQTTNATVKDSEPHHA
jgi:hypothetical protein